MRILSGIRFASKCCLPRSFVAYLAMAAISIGVILRLTIKLPADLWEDEIIAVTHAVQPTWAVIVDSIRYDIHPPLYFLQLHAWSLLGDTDVWFMANSVLWSLFGLGSLYWVVAARFGKMVGLASTAVYAVMPSPVYLADQVRMYAMLAALLIWAWHFANRAFHGPERDRWSIFTLFAIQSGLILIHALGAVAVACLATYALWICKDVGRGYKKWLGCYGLTALLAAPWIIDAAVHGGNVESTTNGRGFVLMLSSSTVGLSAHLSAIGEVTGILIFLFLLVLAIPNRECWRILLCFTALPLGAAVVGSVIQPFFKWNFFSTLQAPFFAIIVGHTIVNARMGMRVFASICVMLFLALSSWNKISFRETSHFLALSKLIKANFQPGDVIFVPQQSYFHGLAWYLDGPYWGSPLKIAPQPSAPWRRVYRELGPSIIRHLDLMPEGEMVKDKAFPILTGTEPTKDAPWARRFWLVSAARADLPQNYPPSKIGRFPRQYSGGKGLQVSLYADGPQSVIGPSDGF